MGTKSMWWLLAILTTSVLVVAEDCEGDLRGFISECIHYMHKGEPSTIVDPNDRCCNVIKNANLPCDCRNFDRKIGPGPATLIIQDLVNWNKVLHCFNFCGNTLPVGTHCGKFTVPPGPPPKS